MRNTAAPTTATTKLYKFNPVTPTMPNVLKSQPPTTAPTTPKMMSKNIPSPDLLTSLLAINPATNPRTIQAKNDIVNSSSWCCESQGAEILSRTQSPAHR